MRPHPASPERLVSERTLVRTLGSSPSSSPPYSPRQSFCLREHRESITSVKEDDCGIAQSFISSHASSLNQSNINSSAICDDDEEEGMIQSPSHFCCALGTWKQIKLSGIQLSKSCGDLTLLSGDNSNICDPSSMEKLLELPALATVVEEKKEYPAIQQAGLSPIERLPMEIFDHIIPLLAVDLPTGGCTARNVDLMSCLLTSRRFHAATLTTLYRRITVPSSYIFSKFLKHLSQYPALGTLVRRLDLSHLTAIGLGRTKRMNAEIQNLTANTLLKCLELTPHLREFLVQEHLQDDLSEAVIQKVLCNLPVMSAVDFCGASSSSFQRAFEAVVNPQNLSLPSALTIRRLSLHECNTLSAPVFEVLLPRLPYLTHLDVCHTPITVSALMSIPKTARLTHLNISKCARLKGPAVVEFLTTHPATRDTLVYLNLLSTIASYSLLSQADVEKLLPRLPSTLRALNLSGAKIVGEHVPLLLPLTKHVEELSLGFSELSVGDLNSLFMPSVSPTDNDENDTERGISEEEASWIPHAVRYLDITGLPNIKASTLFTTASCALLLPAVRPLEVLEIGDKLLKELNGREVMNQKLGWTIKELGRRGWYVRQPSKGQSQMESDSGRRDWKMGAVGWGMRKVPVASGDVGGLYGHYMFKK
ncbi:hypothetical protein FGG08_006381 [Glutinoglossum americanum]|uniref:Uncharacterized protein n=1 Tax=Glutinoglossum americanum TaxID=1670608 RepID=A0A9P8L0Z2_9PEZI|nr:hypothetical protein FGG08_006381 [Glutinoglossum americanum]